MHPLVSGNTLKLGLFCTNGSGASQTLVPEAPEMDWDRSVRTAQAADRAGFEAVVPFARWKGYPEGRPEHRSGRVMEPFTWAAGIAAATENIGVFATSHAPTLHPIVAAKQAATVDHISHGRFALNVVGGWNRPELEMFGAPMREHDERYDHLAEWLEVVRKLWAETEELDFHGRFFDIVGGVSQPKPVQPTIPIMNAGGSPRGMRFAAEHADLCFVIVQSEDEDAIRAQIEGYQRMAREEFGREVRLWTHTVVVQRDTQAEADAYLRRFSQEFEDVESVDAWMRLQGANTQLMPPEVMTAMRQRFAAGAGGFPLVGTAETIAERLEMLSAAGIEGALLTWVDYDAGLADFTRDVLPRLERAGVRTPVGTPAATREPVAAG
ncbi:alkanesulfonate monooxygenase SsuD/methylene tetrahydromethanopterin reductase-like flavin-dependent oxidoreductase (luciferase family) [Actinomycetospora succinea]|uniref:Alkanesulfonate monooxygenase SsuD/methylene tetrahydromethanopterin reductase-like flavin-dependent oxidoreductase (Luciferase family) n=1 Tax=Actinomycetospora succinea TaxID=663603 RepID=A0A4R6VN48_9PSEU|nr:LLM class flavin-dependent oxidoreductase [Actinomycetospora succinea]TDQ65413.1 alkanesulfonate monooxygenase SsuD/methylene tetrahydromethanopterin reductase-like flavin-dependent oxidoreductase (luciferase family) [Actinomycetospora succinea]